MSAIELIKQLTHLYHFVGFLGEEYDGAVSFQLKLCLHSVLFIVVTQSMGTAQRLLQAHISDILQVLMLQQIPYSGLFLKQKICRRNQI